MTLYQRLLTEKHIEVDLKWADRFTGKPSLFNPSLRPRDAEQRLMALTQPLRSL